MSRRSHRKRAFLFLAAVLLPSAVLVGTTLRLIREQRELAVRRTEEERALLALRVGQGLLEELRKVGDRLAGASMTPEDIDALTDSEPAIRTLALAREGRLVFPWEMRPDPSSAPDPASLTRYSRFLDVGAEAEYREGSFYQAAGAYGQAADGLEADARMDGTPTEGEAGASFGTSILVAEARVHQARALLRAERTEEARAVFLLLAKRPPFMVDRDGMPFSLYGLEGLFRSGVKPEDLLPLLESFLGSTPHFALPALLAWREG